MKQLVILAAFALTMTIGGVACIPEPAPFQTAGPDGGGGGGGARPEPTPFQTACNEEAVATGA
jgi:hypothetical protein